MNKKLAGLPVLHPSFVILHPLFLVCFLVVLLVALSGNSDAVDVLNIQDDAVTQAGVLPGASIGQTFVSSQPDLHAIQLLWIVPAEFLVAPSGTVTLHLRRTRDDAADLATASLPVSDLRNNQFSKFVFAPIPDSQGASFYFFLDASQLNVQRGYLSLWASTEDNYAQGQLLLNGAPAPGDLVFRVFYEPDIFSLAGSLAATLARFGTLVPFALGLLFLPGLALVSRSGIYPPAQALSLAGALSLALFSAVSVLQLGWAIPIGLAAFVGSLALLAFRIARYFAARAGQGGLHKAKGATGDPPFTLPLLAVLALAAAIVALLQIRDLSVPLWVDSLSHAATIQTLLTQARLPGDVLYHQGYDAITALLIRLSGATIPDAMLLLGQLLMVQAGLSFFLLARRLSGNPAAGIVAAVIVWFLSPTPAYFITWGRYPLLLGVAILPVALVCAIDYFSSTGFDPLAAALVLVTFAGLAFAHIRLVAFYGVFVAAYLLTSGRARVSLRRMLLVALPILLFALAWLVLLLSRGTSLSSILVVNAAAPEIDLPTVWQIQASHHGPAIGLIALGALFVGIWTRSRVLVLVVAWYVALLLISFVPLGAAGELLSPAFVLLLAFMPAALLIGDAVPHVLEYLSAFASPPRAWQPSLGMANSRRAIPVAAALALVVLLGARDMLSIANPATVLYSGADARAMEWIRANTPPGSRILADSFVWFGTTVMPAGGGWIPYETGRAIDYVRSPQSAGALQPWLTDRHLGYVYFGWSAGLLRRSEFLARPDLFTLVYNRDSVQIFQVK